MKDIGHENMMAFWAAFIAAGRQCIVCELLVGGDLHDWLLTPGNHTDSNVGRVMGEILDAVGVLHDNGVIHRDLKPENVLFDGSHPSARPKIADFGLALVDGDVDVQNAAVPVGTPSYGECWRSLNTHTHTHTHTTYTRTQHTHVGGREYIGVIISICQWLPEPLTCDSPYAP